MTMTDTLPEGEDVLREVWEDATNAVCQRLQDLYLCKCPDGACIAAKVALQFDPAMYRRSALSGPLASTAGAEGWTPDKCSHEPYHGRCVHCDLQFVSGYPALASPAVSSASQADTEEKAR